MLTLNNDILQQIISKALTDAAAYPRWINAINRAADELANNPYIERDSEHGGLLIGSSSGNVYIANGTCQCTAFEMNNPCWHRAAARIVRRYDEKIAHYGDRGRKLQAAQEAANLLNGFA
jgi:hypothetical protein